MTKVPKTNSPLAERMRPEQLKDFIGQEHLVGKGRLLGELIRTGKLPSLILWGPPGCGKTTLATVLANTIEGRFIFFSAVLSGVKEIRSIVDRAKNRQQENNQPTILFVDEIHRFNKNQQDGFLPHVESGLLTLIGATTENPSFQIIAPLLSRCQTLILKTLKPEDIRIAIERALKDPGNGLGKLQLTISNNAMEALTTLADGDCRRALNTLETAASLTLAEKETDKITTTQINEAAQQITLRYDNKGEEHYNLISALHKSMRDSDPDGAAYWLRRMLKSGEDPHYLARRMIRFASEDIGNADPQALQVALNCRQVFHLLGSPEGELALLQAVIYLATAPKSNAIYEAEKKIDQDIRATGSLPVPLHLRNAPTSLMKKIGYGKGYQYAHDDRDGLVLQEHLPEELAGQQYYQPTNRGFEAILKDRLGKWRQILKTRAVLHEKTERK